MTDESRSGGDPEAQGSGSYSLDGYDYQIEVSVWIALALVMVNRLTDQVVLEPMSEEDLESDLDEFEPGRVTGIVQVESYRLVVQAKKRSGDAWTAAGIKALLLHGNRRTSVKERLLEKNVRYLLVTDSSVNGVARGMVVSLPGAWPSPSEMPHSISSELYEGAAGRVAVLASKGEELIDFYIKDILLQRFRVPNSKLNDCVRALWDEARIRIKGAGAGVWRREEISTVIRRHDGYLADSHELDRYVHPSNWEDLREKMRKESAALIIGKSGTGKTMATRKLFEELRAEIPGLTRVPITLGPTQLKNDRTLPPVLYDIEDPWGRFDFDPQSRPWNDQITTFFAEATPGRMIVATTRHDVAVAAHVKNSVMPWAIPLEAEHYRRAQRQLLYRSRIDDLPRNLRAMAAGAEMKVLGQLSTPLEIQKFFDELPIIEGDVTRNPASHVTKAIERAHERSIEETVRLQVEHRGDFHSASVLWALLKVTTKVTTPLLIRLEDLFSDADRQYDGGLVALASFFVAARNFRQQDTLLSYYHPRVEAGLGHALRSQHSKLRRGVKSLIVVLASLPDEDAEWGLSTAARVVQAAVQTFALNLQLGADVTSKIDEWLSRELLKEGEGLGRALQLAAIVGSARNNLAEFARFIEHRPDKTFPRFSYWHAPSHEEDWYERLRQDSRVPRLIDAFVERVLVDSRDHFHISLTQELKRLSPDVTKAFVRAALRIASYGVVYSSDVVVEGALDDLESFELVLDRAVQELEHTPAQLAQIRDEILQIENEVFSENYAEHLSENDDGYTASEIVESYVSRLRRDGHWSAIPHHRHKLHMLRPWARDLAKDDALDVVELHAAFSEMEGHEAESSLWHAVSRVELEPFFERLTKRLTQQDSHPDIWTSALSCLVEKTPSRIADVISELEAARRHSRMMEIAMVLGRLQSHNRVDSEKEDAAFKRQLVVAGGMLPPVLQEVVLAAFNQQKKQDVVLSSAVRAWIGHVADATEEVRVFRLNFEELLQGDPLEDVAWVLEHSKTRDSCALAIQVAARHDMKSVLEDNLGHRYARVTAEAVRYLAGPLRTPLPDIFLDMARAEPSPIRWALVEVLAANPQPEHIPALLTLAADRWSRGHPQYGDAVDFPIAVAAVKALAQYPGIEETVARHLLLIGQETKDYDLQFEIFQLLLERGDASFCDELLAEATNGSGQSSQTSARALLVKSAFVQEGSLSTITAPVLRSRPPRIAAMLAMLVALRASDELRIGLAEQLATSASRRILLLLMLWVTEDDASFRHALARMLPGLHPAVRHIIAGELENLDENSLDELGDAQMVSVVLSFLKPKPIRS